MSSLRLRVSVLASFELLLTAAIKKMLNATVEVAFCILAVAEMLFISKCSESG